MKTGSCMHEDIQSFKMNIFSLKPLTDIKLHKNTLSIFVDET